MSTTTAPSATLDAASALTALMPMPVSGVQIRPDDLAADGAATAFLASFVGATSAEVALALTDDLPTDGLVSGADVLRPALEAATAALGSGILSDITEGDAGDLLAASDVAVYDLNAPDGRTLGWFAIRLRPNANPGGRATGASRTGRISRINDVEMTLTVEIGRTRMSVRDVLDLEPGGVVELDRSAGAPADLLLNGRLIAHGEVVVVDQDYAIRVTQILDATEAD
ncbi:flagellar motor switch protein FliN [Occultella glacieicola]|uniref:Flagellar motor switch protein FliN n=1 Tax=Occultella glacieicola TaxID=2518684 RepID=A0ABY2E9B1_9MICO|nr:flagellar motor switch protein FliN [Occultella glacieicola]TDE98649.1 flagellar motor switch protein FliN [Occultella glacieicola]